MTRERMTQDEMVAEGKRRAEALRVAEGRPVLPDRGPLVEMMFMRGLPVETIRNAVAFVGGTDDKDFVNLIGTDAQEKFLRDAARSFASRGLTT